MDNPEELRARWIELAGEIMAGRRKVESESEARSIVFALKWYPGPLSDSCRKYLESIYERRKK